MPIYLDCAATTRCDPRVSALMARMQSEVFGNPGSRHAAGEAAREVVEQARWQVAELAGCSRGEVVFTSGATESNNLAIAGLAAHGESVGRKHLVASAIEHPAALEPLRALARRGFELELIPPEADGAVDAARMAAAVRPETLLVSLMAVNNETGCIQPVEALAERLADHPAYLHCDAAQAFGKLELPHPRVDLLSLSGHKLHAPMGVGALIARRRGRQRPPLSPLLVGGGQERGLRAGTLPAPLIAALGLACELANRERAERASARERIEAILLAGLAPLEPVLHGGAPRVAGILNLHLPGRDNVDVIEAWAEHALVSDGAACSAATASCSHVLAAMGLPEPAQHGALRISWSHLTDPEALEAALPAMCQVFQPRPAQPARV